MTIIKANIQHLEDLLPLFDNYRVFYKQVSDYKAAKIFLQDRLMQKDSVIYIAYKDNLAVGFTQLYSLFSSVSMQPLYILNDLYVDHNYRKQKIGMALLNKAKELCREKNYKGLALQTETTNPARYLYESLGWKIDKDLQYFWICD